MEGLRGAEGPHSLGPCPCCGSSPRAQPWRGSHSQRETPKHPKTRAPASHSLFLAGIMLGGSREESRIKQDVFLHRDNFLKESDKGLTLHSVEMHF